MSAAVKDERLRSWYLRDLSGFATTLGEILLRYQYGGMIDDMPTLVVTDVAGCSVTLKAFPKIPTLAALLGKTHIIDAAEGSTSDWWILKPTENRFYSCFLRSDASDHAYGKSINLELRGEQAFSLLSCETNVDGLPQTDRQALDDLSGALWMKLIAGEDRIVVDEVELIANL